MTYTNTVPGTFISRPNRFISYVDIDSETVIAHVKNTGRCKELLIPGAKVILQKSDNPKRKTKYDLIAVYKGKKLINMDSQAPNQVFLEYLQTGRHIENITKIKPEAKYGNSRFDVYVEAGKHKIFIEVKGVTLENDGVVMFPDAPTERGVKHLNELARCVKAGFEAQAVFIIQMSGVSYFTPNNKTHPAFGEAMITAEQAGVKMFALNCAVDENSLNINEPVKIKLPEGIK
jgi:sugar fermentation stimulation protein A